MSKFRIGLIAVGFMAFMLVVSSGAQAQATRTWVSGVGDDVNPCSRTAPCKTYAGAISKTAKDGEISTLDPGGYGAVTITKSITINGGGTGQGYGSIIASLVNGVIINITDPADVRKTVRLNWLDINGASTGLNGVRFVAGSALHIENSYIDGFTGHGVDVALASAGQVLINNTTIRNCVGNGINIAGTNAAPSAVTLDHLHITRCGNGLRVTNRARVAISDSTLSINNRTASAAALLADSAVSDVIVDVENCQINFNAVGTQANAGNTIRLSNTHMTANGNALFFNGGTIASFGNNRIAGNNAGENFSSLVDITQQ